MICYRVLNCEQLDLNLFSYTDNSSQEVIDHDNKFFFLNKTWTANITAQRTSTSL